MKGNLDLCLVFKRSKNLELFGFCDSDWGGDPNDRRSTSGYCFKLSVESSVICWSSRKQQTVALSSTEAEYMRISSAAQESVYLLSLCKSLGFDLGGPVLLHGDNQGAIKLARNPITHSRSKHIDNRHHFVRDLVERKVIQLEYLPTDQNLADILTKALAGPKFMKLRCGLFGLAVQSHWGGVLAFNEKLYSPRCYVTKIFVTPSTKITITTKQPLNSNNQDEMNWNQIPAQSTNWNVNSNLQLRQPTTKNQLLHQKQSI